MTTMRSDRPSSSSKSDEITTTATPLVAQSPQDLVDRLSRPDVDALGRLVEDQHLGVEQQPAGDDDLLLHAAGEVQHVGVKQPVSGQTEAGAAACDLLLTLR